MDWNVADGFQKANHNPVITLNGNKGKAIGHGKIKAGDKVVLSAKGSSDIDGNKLNYKWWVYKEAGNVTQKIELTNAGAEEMSFTMPQLGNDAALHIILEVEDNGSPTLTSYRRAVLVNQR
jgi:hypothetical protein